MLKKTVIALAALGFVGTATLTPTAPAEAFFLCAKNSKHKNSKWCQTRAERQARWAAFWDSIFPRRKKRR